MSTETLLVETDGPVTRLTINRPEALNALNPETLEAMSEALAALGSSARVVILAGAGDRAFVAGADITAMAEWTPQEAERFSKLGHRVADQIASLDAVVIAAVDGFALGGGCELALACDFIVASDKALFGQPEVQLGVIPGFGGTTRLTARVGAAMATRLVTTAERLSADQAFAIGLVTEVVPQADFDARIQALVKMILKNAPNAVGRAKHAVGFAAQTTLDAANAFEQKAFAMCFDDAEQKEGMKAFGEKRKPAWNKA